MYDYRYLTSPFNRTSMESKLCQRDPMYRTSVSIFADAFNRTSMESKLCLLSASRTPTILPCALLIEPVWNRNIVAKLLEAEIY